MIWSKEGLERNHRPDMVSWEVGYFDRSKTEVSEVNQINY